MSLATGPNRACYIPVGHSGADLYSDAPNQLPMSLVLDKLRPLLENPAILKIGHNFKYDWVMFDKAGINVAPVDDTMVMSFDLDAGKSFSHSLKDCLECGAPPSRSENIVLPALGMIAPRFELVKRVPMIILDT